MKFVYLSIFCLFLFSCTESKFNSEEIHFTYPKNWMVQEEIDSDGARTLSIEHKREENHGIVVIAEMLGIIDFAEFIDIQKKSISSLNDWKNVKIDTSRNVQLNNQFFDKIKVSFTSENGEGVSEVFHKNMNKKTYFITTTILLDTQKIKDDILMLSEFKNSFVIDEQ